MINSLEVQHELWDRVKVLDKLRKIEVPVAKSYVVYRGGGPSHEFTQEMIEAQSINTKDKGLYYINKARNEKEGKGVQKMMNTGEKF